MRDPLFLRPLLEDLLGSRLPDKTWRFLVDEGRLHPILYGNPDISTVVNSIRAMISAFGQPVPQKGNAPQMLTNGDKELEGATGSYARQVTISLLAAEYARKNPQVQQFRRAVGIDDTSYKAWQEVGEWIQESAGREGSGFTWFFNREGHIDSGKVADAAIGSPNKLAPIEMPRSLPVRDVMDTLYWRLVHYSVPGDEWERLWAVRAGGILDYLCTLSAALAEEYAWTEAQATVFVLTDIPPLLRLFLDLFEPARTFPALSRLHLIVDPALSANEELEHYLRARDRVVGSRPRDLTEKHLRLALFLARQKDKETWGHRMALWNNLHPEMAYQNESQFGRDATQARRRLLRPDYRFAVEKEENDD